MIFPLHGSTIIYTNTLSLDIQLTDTIVIKYCFNFHLFENQVFQWITYQQEKKNTSQLPSSPPHTHSGCLTRILFNQPRTEILLIANRAGTNAAKFIAFLGSSAASYSVFVAQHLTYSRKFNSCCLYMWGQPCILQQQQSVYFHLKKYLQMLNSFGSQTKCAITKITFLRVTGRGEKSSQCPGMTVSKQHVCCSLPMFWNRDISTFTNEAEQFITGSPTSC